MRFPFFVAVAIGVCAMTSGWPAESQTAPISLDAILRRMGSGELLEGPGTAPEVIQDSGWAPRLRQMWSQTAQSGKEVSTAGYFVGEAQAVPTVLPIIPGNETQGLADAVLKIAPAGSAKLIIIAHSHPEPVTFSPEDASFAALLGVAMIEVSAKGAELLVPTRKTVQSSGAVLMMLSVSSWLDDVKCEAAARGGTSYADTIPVYEPKAIDAFAGTGMVRYKLDPARGVWTYQDPPGAGREFGAFYKGFTTRMGDAVRLTALILGQDETQRAIAAGTFGAAVTANLGKSFVAFATPFIEKMNDRTSPLAGRGVFSGMSVSPLSTANRCDGRHKLTITRPNGEVVEYEISRSDGKVDVVRFNI